MIILPQIFVVGLVEPIATTGQALTVIADPTVAICYLIWPCDIALCITYPISQNSYIQ